MDWTDIVNKVRLIKDKFDKSYKCLNTDRNTRDETVEKHITILVNTTEEIRVILNVHYSRLTTAHKAAADNFYKDVRDKLAHIFERKGIENKLPHSLHEQITYNVKFQTPHKTMTLTVTEFLGLATRTIPEFNGKIENLQSFIDALEIIESIKGTHEPVAVSVIKTKLKGTTRNLINEENTIQRIIAKLKSSIKGESTEVITAKMRNNKQHNKTASTFADEMQELTKALAIAYIADGIPNQVAEKYSMQAAVKAITTNATNERVRLIMESSNFNTMDEVVAKFVNSCTESSPAGIMYYNQSRYGNNRKRYNNAFKRNYNQGRNRNHNSNQQQNYNGNGRNNNNGHENRYNRNNTNRYRNVRMIQDTTENEETPVDTGADISLIKNGQIAKQAINRNVTTSLQGIGKDRTYTVGTVITDLKINNLLVRHEFHVVDDELPIPADGILGLDFIKKYNCVLDYQGEQDLLILRPIEHPSDIPIPMTSAPLYNSIALPARAEVIRSININSPHKNILIPHQEIQSGIFIASTITTSDHPLVRIINTTPNNTVIQNINLKSENMENYETIIPRKESNNAQKLQKLSEHFPDFVKDELKELCKKYIDVFALETEKITVNNFYKQKLRLKDTEPTYIKNYRIPYKHKEEVTKQINKMIEDDIIEPSASEYNSPIILVPKKNLPGSDQKRWRLVVDYRGINKKLTADKFPLPRIDDILDNLGRAKYFSCLDLTSGFHQIEMEEDSRDITSFSTDKGSFRFKRLPYGLKIAPNSFQRMMTMAFAGLSPAQAFLYMDDLVVLGRSENHMLQNLADVFDTCRKYNLKLHPGKCTFFGHEVTYLGHKCTDKGILPDDSKFKVIQNYPTPKNADETKRFVAFCNYYRRFVPNFAEHSRILTQLCKKNAKFEWTSECEKAFQYLKDSLLTPQILKYPDFERPFCITTDASKKACGAVLSQEYNGLQLPIAYASRSFTRGESNKSTIEQELAAIHWAIKYFRPYIYGTKFRVRSDHRPLTYLFAMKNPSSKLTRMRLDLEEYDFTVEYLRGKDNHAADALSRIEFSEIRKINRSEKILQVTTRQQSAANRAKPAPTNPKETASTKLHIYETPITKRNKNTAKLVINGNYMHITKNKVDFKKKDDKIITINISQIVNNGKIDLSQLFPMLEKLAVDNKLHKLQQSLGDQIFEKIRIQEYKDKGNILLEHVTIELTPKIRKITDEAEKIIILQKYHDDPIWGGHPGITRTLRKIRQYFSWKNMTKDVTQHVKKCDKCNKNKTFRNTKEEMILTPTPAKAFDIVQIDTIGPLPRTQNNNVYAVTIICDLTKYLITIPTGDKSANTIAKAIVDNCILVYGPMKKIITDMGSEYKNQIFDEMCKLLGVENVTSTAYHHQTLGTVERSHRTLNEYVRSYVSIDKTDWDDWMKYFTYSYNTTPSLAHDYCPYELIFGKTPSQFDFLSTREVDPVYNIEAYDKEIKYRLQMANSRAKQLIESNKIKRKAIYDRNKNSIGISIGELVYVDQIGHKLDNLYKGPYEVIALDDRNNCLLKTDNDKTTTVHLDRVRRYDG